MRIQYSIKNRHTHLSTRFRNFKQTLKALQRRSTKKNEINNNISIIFFGLITFPRCILLTNLHSPIQTCLQAHTYTETHTQKHTRAHTY